jgi:ribokinase
MPRKETKNNIVVIPGANSRLMPQDIEIASDDIASAGMVVCQLEIPIETVEKAASIAWQNNVPFILDPAPARPLSDNLLKMVHVIKPNETEAQAITGIKIIDTDSVSKAADWFLAKGVKNVIITLGEKGALLADKDTKQVIESRKVNVIDSTAAGDVFTGALAYSLNKGKSLKDSAVYANIAAAISVQRLGAQNSMPTREEVDYYITQELI